MKATKPTEITRDGNSLLINGEVAVFAQQGVSFHIVQPGDFGKFRTMHINKHLNEVISSDWYISDRDGEHKLRYGSNGTEINLEAGKAHALQTGYGFCRGDLMDRMEVPPANFSRMYFLESSMHSTVFRQSIFHTPFGIANSYLAEAMFPACSFGGISFDRCNLTGANFCDSSLRRVTFMYCDMKNVDFSDAMFVERVSFWSCDHVDSIKLPKSPDSVAPIFD